ncbi:MAG: GntR family transcriptional regulator [Burkholderiaceae bacterium]|nr:GntR family transcriptional regulator [Burkholderiaceae bacterium]
MDQVKHMDGEGSMHKQIITLDRQSPLPLYEQVKRRLLSVVLNWKDASDRFYTDQELSEYFGVSRMTVRQAVQELVDGGYLRRARGSGTFVCGKKVEERFSLTKDFVDQWADAGQLLKLKVLACVKQPCPVHVSEELQLQSDELVWSIIRLRKVKQVPISIDYRFIPVKIIDSLSKKQVSAGSLLGLMNNHIDLSYGKLTVEAAAVQVEHADYLDLITGDPILRRSLIYYDVENRPVMSGTSYYRSDQVRYSIHVPLSENSVAENKITDKLEFKKQVIRAV